MIGTEIPGDEIKSTSIKITNNLNIKKPKQQQQAKWVGWKTIPWVRKYSHPTYIYNIFNDKHSLVPTSGIHCGEKNK